MVTGLSSPLPIMSTDEREEKRRGLVTRDLLGGCDTAAIRPSHSGEFDLNLLSGSAYLESRQLQDLNLPPPPAASPPLQLGLTAPSRPSPLSYQSVCTLDKVRFALERAERESRKQRSDATAVSPSSSTTTTTSSVKRRAAAGEGDEGEDVSFESSSSGAGAAMMAAGCPKCLMYVLISKGNPTCPRCGSHVPVMVLESSKKRPRIDLNSTEQILI